MDVFISYSHRDAAWARGELLHRIEAAGLRAFIDFRDFRPGYSSIQEIERGIAECRKTVAVLTPAYVESFWTMFEKDMLQTLAQEGRLIPLLRIDSQLPLSLRALDYIDFTEDADQELAWQRLFAALGNGSAETVAPADPPQWLLSHPYATSGNFTGRLAERGMLSDWLNGDNAHPLLVLRALGGFGKSALAWHWLLNNVDAKRWPQVLWWSFYEENATFESFLAASTEYLGVAEQRRDRIAALLDALRSNPILLILDGFERALRGYGGIDSAYRGDDARVIEGNEADCLSPQAETLLRHVGSAQRLRGKVLLTTRILPAALRLRGGFLLNGCREEELLQLQPEDAVAFFRVHGIRGTRAEIKEVCERYGYHPLSLRILVGVIVHDLEQPGDVAAARDLDITGDLIQRQNHVLKIAYDRLGPTRQRLLSRIACIRGTVTLDGIRKLSDDIAVDDDLHALLGRGLVHRDLDRNLFDLHPIVRNYAFDRLTVSDRNDAHTRMRAYYGAFPVPARVRSLTDLGPVIELYHHTVRSGGYEEARRLFRDRLDRITYYEFGAYDLQIELLLALFPEGRENGTPLVRGIFEQASVLNDLACAYCLNGQPKRAVPLFEREQNLLPRASHRVLADFGLDLQRANLAISVANLAALARIPMGALRDAESSLRQSISLSLSENDVATEAMAHQELGRLHAYRGDWNESDEQLQLSTRRWTVLDNRQGLCIDESYRSLLQLLRVRAALAQGKTIQADARRTPLGPARRALLLADQVSSTGQRYERDYVRVHWLLGAAYRLAGSLSEAEAHLREALERCRRSNAVEAEADILIEMARVRTVRTARNAHHDARELADEALIIAERSGYTLQAADACLALAQLARLRGDRNATREAASRAFRFAKCDGPEHYTYKAAYDEAEATLRAG